SKRDWSSDVCSSDLHSPTPARRATAAALACSSSAYGSPAARMRSGRLCAVNSTCTAPGTGKRCSARLTRSATASRSLGWSPQLRTRARARRPRAASSRYGSTSSGLPGPPYAITSTATPSAAMHQVHDALQRLDRGLRQHAVPEVEDVTGTARGPVEHVAHPLLELGERREQRRGIEV